MEDILEQLKKGKRIRMTDAERARIRGNLARLTGTGSAAPHSQEPKQMASRVSPYVSPSPIGTFGLFAKAVMFVLVGFIVGGTTLSFASENALPGTPLYPIKTQVAEKLGGLFAFSTESKARYLATLVDKRVTEIETLQTQGKLTDVATEQSASASFSATFNDYQGRLAQLDTEGRVARVSEIAQPTLIKLNSFSQSLTIATPTTQNIRVGGGSPMLMQINSMETSPLSDIAQNVSSAVSVLAVVSGQTNNTQSQMNLATPQTVPSSQTNTQVQVMTAAKIPVTTIQAKTNATIPLEVGSGVSTQAAPTALPANTINTVITPTPNNGAPQENTQQQNQTDSKTLMQLKVAR